MLKIFLLSFMIACCLGAQAFAQYQWNRLDMFGTNVYEVAAHTDGGILAATSSGIYRSIDNGEHWTRFRELFPSYVSSFPSFTNIGETFDLAGNGYVMARVYIDGWHYYSSDHGITWQEISDSAEYIHKGMTIRLTTPANTLLFGVYDSGIWRSTDSGATYKNVLSTPSNTPVVLTQTSSGILFTGGENGQVFSSSDDGKTWTEYAVPGTEAIINRQMLVDGKELIFLAGKSVYRSTDGIQWQETRLSDSIGIGSAILSPEGDIITVVRDDKGLERIGRLPKGAQELIISGEGLTYFPISNIAIGANGWFTAAKGGIHRSVDNGATWQKSDRGIYNTLRSVLSVENGTTLLNSFYDLYRYEGSSTVVNSLRANLPRKDIGGLYEMTRTQKGTILITAGADGFYRSTDQGMTFENIASHGFIGGICTRSNGDIIASIDNQGILVSKDDGKTWSGLTQFPSGIQISVLDHVAESQDGALFVCSLAFGYIIRIDPNMTNASLLTNPNTGHPGYALLLHQDDIFVVDNYSDVLRGKFTDATIYWTKVTPPAITSKNSISNLALGPNGEVFCASSFGLYRTNDRGTTWEAVGWQDNAVNRVCVDSRGRLYVNVRDSGAYVAQIPTGIAEDTPVSLQEVLVSPNPASDRTQLHFTMHHSGQVRILLYNALGQDVTTVDNGFQEAGEHIVPIQTHFLAPGMYRYSIQTGSEVITGSLTVVR